jgi:hypothetical protein
LRVGSSVSFVSVPIELVGETRGVLHLPSPSRDAPSGTRSGKLASYSDPVLSTWIGGDELLGDQVARLIVDVVEVPGLNKFDHPVEAHEVRSRIRRMIGSFGQVLSGKRVVFMGDDEQRSLLPPRDPQPFLGLNRRSFSPALTWISICTYSRRERNGQRDAGRVGTAQGSPWAD